MDDVTKTDKMLSKKEGNVGYVIFNNPERHNAVSLEMWARVGEILESFRNDKDSPIPADKKNSLLPLAYFPIDESYAVPASLEPSADRSRIQVPWIGSVKSEPEPTKAK